MAFGHSFRKQHFPQLDSEVVPVNHGSYGLPPQCVIEKFYAAIGDDLAYPDRYIRTKQQKEYVASLKLVAQYLNCPHQNLALVDNVSVGINAVLRSLPFQKGDKIAIATTTFLSCVHLISFLEELMGVEAVIVDIEYPLLDSEVLEKWREAFAAHKIKLALFDTVTIPGVKVPFIELTTLCREFGVLSMVDGAHLIGLLPMDFEKFRPDFYVSNLHKWLYIPRGCACLYVAPEHHRTIQTIPISHHYVKKDAELLEEKLENLLVSKFAFTGAKTFAAVSCIPEALRFREEQCGGDEKIRAYRVSLAHKAGEIAERKFPGAKVLENDENSLVTAMLAFSLPLENYSPEFDFKEVKSLIGFVLEELLQKFKTFAPFNVHGGKLYCRISCEIYNEESDYEYLCEAIDASLRAYFDQKEKNI